MRVPNTIVVAGDELVAGRGDGRALGWVGRVHARTLLALPDASLYALGVPGEGTAELSSRVMQEAGRRFSDQSANRLVIALGQGDLDANLTLARSRLNLANILDDALSNEVSAFVVGPPPAADEDRNRRLAELSQGFGDVATRRQITYVDTFAPLRHHAVWQREVAASRDGLPSQEGYGLMAWLVLNRGWFDWLGVAPPQ